MKMSRTLGTIAIGLALGAIPAAAQQRHSTQWRTKPAEDDKIRLPTVEAARVFVAYSQCVVQNRYDRARAMVLVPYASPQQAAAASRIVKTRNDACFRSGGFDTLRVTFRPDMLAGGIAQVLVLKEYPDLPAVVGSFPIVPADENARLAQLNAAEVFGRCVVQRDPAASLALFASSPGTGEERAAVKRLLDDLNPCLAAGSKLAINEMFLRNVTAVAAYRFAQQIQPRDAAQSGGGK